MGRADTFRSHLPNASLGRTKGADMTSTAITAVCSTVVYSDPLLKKASEDDDDDDDGATRTLILAPGKHWIYSTTKPSH